MSVTYGEPRKGRHSGPIDFRARTRRSSGFIDITIYLSAERQRELQRPELRGILGAMKLMKMIWGGEKEDVGAPSEATSQHCCSE